MAELSRRAFIQRTSVGLAAAAAVTAVPLIGATQKGGKKKSAARIGSTATDASSGVVAHITDRQTGEIHLYVGEREVIHHNKALVSQLLSAANLSA
jgi:hypothetical protein